MAEDKKTVLVVDDEPDVRTFISTLLEDHGYTVVTAEDGVDALTKVKASKPDLITLDITMPEKSGVRFYRDMREDEAYKAIPIIMVTGISGEFEKFISTRSQVPPPDGFIHKPVDKQEILALIAKLA